MSDECTCGQPHDPELDRLKNLASEAYITVSSLVEAVHVHNALLAGLAHGSGANTDRWYSVLGYQKRLICVMTQCGYRWMRRDMALKEASRQAEELTTGMVN